MIWLAIWIVCSLAGCGVMWAINEWTRRYHPDVYEHRTGLPAERVRRMTDQRRQRGIQSYETRELS